MPPIETPYKQNFQTLVDATKSGHICLLDCLDNETGRPVRVVCAVNRKGGDYEIVPLAKLFDGNPYEQISPPDGRGGYERRTDA